MEKQRDDNNLIEVNLIENPAHLSPEEASRITEDFIGLSWRACGGKDWRNYDTGRSAWTRFYQADGNRPRDFDFIITVYKGLQLIYMTCFQLVKLTPSTTAIWCHLGMTDPQYQGTGNIARTFKEEHLAGTLAFFDKVEGQRFLVARTPNPIVYEVMRRMTKPFMPAGQFFPDIDPSAHIRPIPQRIRELAVRISEKLSSNCYFDPESFVLKGYFKEFGSLYHDYDFPCRNDAVTKYFEEHLDRSNMDGIMIIVDFGDSPDRNATVNLRGKQDISKT